MAPTFTRSTTASELVLHYAPLIKNKTIVLTGASPTSLGGTFLTIAARASPRLLILAGRDTSKLQETATAITNANPSVPTKLLHLDLTSLESVRKAAAEVNGWSDVPRIDVLVNNAGIMAVEYGATKDGMERHFGVNHVAHFLFTNLVVHKVARVVNVSSDAHRLSHVRFYDWGFDVSLFFFPSFSFLCVL